jgi:hypothetical protein
MGIPSTPHFGSFGQAPSHLAAPAFPKHEDIVLAERYLQQPKTSVTQVCDRES